MMQCAGCQKAIDDRYVYMIQDRVWHGACILCCECRSVLRERCYHRDGKYFCRKDFFRLFGTLCSGCGQGIAPDCLIHRFGSRVYHRECLTCAACGRKLETGDVMRIGESGVLVCRCSFGDLEEREDQTTASKRTQSGSSSRDEYGEKVEERDKARDTASSGDGNSHDDDQRGSSDSEKMEKGDSQSSSTAAPEGKRRGPRTTIKARQLEMLKSAFNHAPKPSRQARERLAKETGLTMRVIQVWFQNRRSKERRMRQLDNTGKSMIHGQQPGMQQRSQQLSYPPTILHQDNHGFYSQHAGQYHAAPVHYSQQLQSRPVEQAPGARGPLTTYHGQTGYMPPPPPESNVPYSYGYHYSVPYQSQPSSVQAQRLHRPSSRQLDMISSPPHHPSTMTLQHMQDVGQLAHPPPRKLSTTSSMIWIPQQLTVMEDCIPPPRTS